MPLAQYQRPVISQPALARINPNHWLAKDLIFAHSGLTPFVLGRPIADTTSALRSRAITGTQLPALNNTAGWVPDGTNYEQLDLGGVLTEPLTLSAWFYGTSNTTVTRVLTLAPSSGEGGVTIGRGINNRSNLGVNTAANSFTTVTSTGTFTAGQWQSAVGVFISSTSRVSYMDGGNATSNTTSRVVPEMNVVRICGNHNATPIACHTGIQAFAMPMAINRALDADEVARLYAEQISNPWVLFAERPIWVPMSSPSATVPTLSASTFVPGSLTSTGWRPQITAS